MDDEQNGTDWKVLFLIFQFSLLLTKWLRNDASTIARWWHSTIKPHVRGITVNNCKMVYFHKARVNHNKFLSVPHRTEQTSFYRSTSHANKPNEKAVDVEVWKVYMLSVQLKLIEFHVTLSAFPPWTKGFYLFISVIISLARIIYTENKTDTVSPRRVYSLIWAIRYVRPQRVGFFSCFGHN